MRMARSGLNRRIGISERAQRVSHANGAGIAGVPASERVGESEGRSPSDEDENGAPGRIRTCDLWLRRPTLYPAELRARTKTEDGKRKKENGRRKTEDGTFFLLPSSFF